MRCRFERHQEIAIAIAIIIGHPGMVLVNVSEILVRKVFPSEVVPLVLVEVGDLHEVIYRA